MNPGDISWVLVASCLVMLMTPGLAFFYAGMVSKRNVISTLLQSFIALGVVSLLWVTLGYGLSFGPSVLGGFIGDPSGNLFLETTGWTVQPALSSTVPVLVFALFQMKFAVITPALITGAFAERVRFSSYLVFMVLFSLGVYAPICHWTWHPEGFLHRWGVLDFAGGAVVHISAGFAALAGAMVVGRRSGPGTDGTSNIPFVVLGTGLLWFGWFGFNAGSALAANEQAAMAFATTNTASAASMLVWLLVDRLRGRKPSAIGACTGAVVGLVAITPAAGFVTLGASVMIGAIAAVVCNFAAHQRGQSQLDDTLDVFSCHGVGGVVGMVLTGVFAGGVGSWDSGNLGTTMLQFFAACMVSSYAFWVSWVMFKLLNWVLPLRVSAEDEAKGLDRSQHDEAV